MPHTDDSETSRDWTNVSYDEKERIKREVLARPDRKLMPGDMTVCASTNASQDIGETGIVLQVSHKDPNDPGVLVMRNSKRCGFSIGWSYVYPWLKKA